MKGKKMNKKVLYGVLTGTLVLASIGMTACLTRPAKADETTSVTSSLTTENLANNLVDETVYVFLNSDGSVKKTISSDWTKNDLGVDVYSKNEGKVSAPIEVKISYFLDGKEVTSDEIRGRSGKVKIRYDYTNTNRVNGMYVPYAVISGAILSNEHFKNIKVTNAHLENDGDRAMVVGLALPGVKDDLAVSADIPEFVEIEADATEFKMEMTATVATSKVFADIDTSSLDSVDSLSAQLDTLASSMAQLMDGSVKLRDGLSELDSKTGVLADGVNQLRDGSLQLVAGSKTLHDGLSSAVSGSKELVAGLNSVNTGTKTLSGGIANAYDGAKQVDAGVDAVVESMNNLAGGFQQLNEGDRNTQLITGATNLFDGIIAGLEQSGFAGINNENYEGILSAAIQSYTEAGDTAMVQKLSTYLATLKVSAGAIAYVSGVNQIAEAAADGPAKVAPLKEGSSALAAGLKDAADKSPELVKGTGALLKGATDLSNGLSDASEGSSNLYYGLSSLDAGISNLQSNIPALTDGVGKLADGSKSLSDGLSQFNSEGVQKLISLYNGDVKGLVNRVQSMVALARNSNTKVKYIYRTPEI